MTAVGQFIEVRQYVTVVIDLVSMASTMASSVFHDVTCVWMLDNYCISRLHFSFKCGCNSFSPPLFSLLPPTGHVGVPGVGRWRPGHPALRVPRLLQPGGGSAVAAGPAHPLQLRLVQCLRPGDSPNPPHSIILAA